MLCMKYAIIKTVWRRGELLHQILYTTDREAARKTLGDARRKMSIDKASREISEYAVYLAEIIDGSCTVPDPAPVKVPPRKKDIRLAMVAYLDRLGYSKLAVSVKEGDATAVLPVSTPPSIAHFTEVKRTPQGTYWVRLAKEDFNNKTITNNKFNL